MKKSSYNKGESGIKGHAQKMVKKNNGRPEGAKRGIVALVLRPLSAGAMEEGSPDIPMEGLLTREWGRKAL